MLLITIIHPIPLTKSWHSTVEFWLPHLLQITQYMHTSKTYELVNKITKQSCLHMHRQDEILPEFFFKVVFFPSPFFEKSFLLNAGALHGSQTAAAWYLQPREALENNRLSWSQQHTIQKLLCQLQNSPVTKVGKIRWQSRIFIGKTNTFRGRKGVSLWFWQGIPIYLTG